MASKPTSTTPAPQSRRAARAAELARQERQRRLVRGALVGALALVLVVVGVLAFTSGGTAKTADATGQGYVADPEAFRLPGLIEQDRTVALADFKGTPVVVNFFASWCVYCNEELPGFVQVAKATAGQVAFVGVNTGDPGDGVAMARRFDLAGAGFSLARDIGDDPASDLWLSYGSQGLPVTAFYDANGAVVDFAGGMLTQEQLEQRISKAFGITVSAANADQLGSPVIPLIPKGAYELLSATPITDAFTAVDLRPADDFAEGHIAEARNLEATAATVVEKAADWDKSGSYFLYDADGTGTEAVAEALRQAGFTHVYFIQGGFAAWVDGGFPTSR